MARKHPWLIVTLLLGVFMGALDIFIVAPALGAIQTGLDVPARLTTWSFTAYTLVLVVTQPFVAKLSDLYGRRWIYAGCVALFGAGSALCATSHGFGPFIVGRCVQAIGAGGILPVANAVIVDVFPEEKRGAMLGLNAIMFGLAFILGPIIGGVLTQGLRLGGLVTDWHAIFIVNLPLAVVVILLAARTLPAVPPRATARAAFDWNGMLLLAAALFLLVFGLTQFDFTAGFAAGVPMSLPARILATLRANITNEAALPCVFLGLAFFVPFVLHEMQTAHPIVDVAAFSRKQLAIAMCLSAIGGVVTTSVVYVPQLVENALGLKTGAGGFYLFYVAITLFFGAGAVGRMIDRYGSRAVMLGGGIISALGFAVLLSDVPLMVGNTHTRIIVALLLIGAGLASLVGTPLRYIVANEARPQHRATSLAVLTICSSIGQTIILPLGGALISSALAAPLDIQLHNPPTDAYLTLRAILTFYTLVLIILIADIGLAAQLKTRRQELADRRVRQAAATRHYLHAPAEQERGRHHEAQPAMSSR
jgi:MFS family permease